MESPRVQIISECFIKPRIQSKDANNPTYLSPWDLAMMNLNYIQKGLLFRSPENQYFSITTFLDDLKHSLSAILTHFHPLAARLATRKQETPPAYVVFLNPENSPGARFIHSAVNLKVSDVLTPTDIPVIVQSFFDHHRAINHDGHQLSLLSVKVTELVDGIFIGCSINHMVADGVSFWHFFNSWSELFKSKALNPISRPPVLEKWLPEGSDPIINLRFTHHDQFIERPDRPFLREKIFHFPSDSLSKLKSKVNLERNTAKISTLQALSALVWRCVTRARRSPPDRQTSCRVPVNNRPRLSPPLPDNYFGNSVCLLVATTTAGKLLDQGIGWAAWLVHETVVKYDDKVIKESARLWIESPRVLKPSEVIDPNGVHMGSSPRFDMYGNEFGLGKALAVRSGYANRFDGKMTLYPGPEGGRSVDLEVSLLLENMAAFECDEELISVLEGEAL